MNSAPETTAPAAGRKRRPASPSPPAAVCRPRTLSPPPPVPPCDVCRDKPAVYTCPRCAVRTCSLQCCTAHKYLPPGGAAAPPSGATGKMYCDGRRDRTAFVEKKRMGDATLHNDYHFLEDVAGRVRSAAPDTSAGRGRGRNPLLRPVNGRTKGRAPPSLSGAQPVPKRLRDLREAAAAECGATVRFMPPGMGRREGNRSRAVRTPGGGVAWTVEVIFHLGGDVRHTLLVHDVPGTAVLRSAGGGGAAASPAAPEETEALEPAAAVPPPAPEAEKAQETETEGVRRVAPLPTGPCDVVGRALALWRKRSEAVGAAPKDALPPPPAGASLRILRRVLLPPERVPPGSGSNARYVLPDPAGTLNDAIRGSEVIEHPTLHVTIDGADEVEFPLLIWEV